METSFAQELPETVRHIGALLHAAGYDALLVGGGVRDIVRGVAPVDQDLVTNAPTGPLRHLLSVDERVRTVYTVSDRHHTLGVLTTDGTELEITRYRPDALGSATVAQRFAIDASHRDFTMNAMGIDLASGGLLDPLDGRCDLQSGVLRAPGSAAARLDEDPLRIIRAARFVAELGYALDPELQDALVHAAPSLALIAPERIRDELTRLLVAADAAKGLRVLRKSGALAVVLPEVAALDGVTQSAFHHLDALAHTIQTVTLVPATPVMRWAALLHDIGKTPTRSVDEKGQVWFSGHLEESERLAGAIMQRLKFPSAHARAIMHLVGCHMRLGQLDVTDSTEVDRVVRSLDLRSGQPGAPPLVTAEDAIALTAADLGSTAHHAEVPHVRERLEAAVAASRSRGTHQPIRSPVNGRDIMAALCLEEGVEIGIALRAVIDALEHGVIAAGDTEGALVVAAAALGVDRQPDGASAVTEGCEGDALLTEDPRYRVRRVVRRVVSIVVIIALLLLLVFGVVRRVPRPRRAPTRPVYAAQDSGMDAPSPASATLGLRDTRA